MDKNKARELLENYLIKQIVYPWSEIKLPLSDCVVKYVPEENKSYTFRYLMCLAYDLQEKKTERL